MYFKYELRSVQISYYNVVRQSIPVTYNLLEEVTLPKIVLTRSVVPRLFAIERFHTISKLMEPLSNRKHSILDLVKIHTYNGMNASVF